MGVAGVLIDGGAWSDGVTLHAVVQALAALEPAVEVVVAVPSETAVPDGVVVLPVDRVGVAADDPRVVAMAAAGAACHLRELVVVTAPDRPLHAAAERCGCRIVPVVDVPAAIEVLRAAEQEAAGRIGVPPHPTPWPDDARLDPELLAAGDRRNVVDRFRYWREQAIVEELDRTRLPVHVAVENWQHDLNIGTVVRNANAFNVAGVHIVGKRRWNRRGAMATDRYLSVRHHESVAAFTAWAAGATLPVVGIDNVAGSVALEAAPLPGACVLVFGQEGPGISAPMRAACAEVREITQLGSTRSINVGVASGIALHWWASHRS